MDVEKESTLFGDLLHIEVTTPRSQKQTSRMSRQIIEDLEKIKKAQAELKDTEKIGRTGADDFRVRASTDIAVL